MREVQRLTEETGLSLDSLEVDPSIYVTGQGVTFKLRKVARMAIVEASRRLPLPKPPRIFMEEKGREEENPNDPVYQEALQKVNWDRGVLTVSVYVLLGTKLVNVPPDLDSPDGVEWLQTLEYLGIPVPDNPRDRYVAWVKYYALTDEELADMMKAIMRYSGISLEEDVKEAADSFQGDPARSPDNGVPASAIN